MKDMPQMPLDIFMQIGDMLSSKYPIFVCVFYDPDTQDWMVSDRQKVLRFDIKKKPLFTIYSSGK